jgi:protein transport protein SEC24
MRLEVELGRNLRRTYGFEGVMRVRTSKGLCVDEYLMGTDRRGEQEIDVPGIDADSAFAVTFRHDEKLSDGQPMYVQLALLYTTSGGQRRVRVLTLGFQATEAMASLYRYADLDVLLNVMMRRAVLDAAQKNMHLVREAVVNTTVKMLFMYRKMCASASTAQGQLILPESLKLLPLYALSLTKNGLMRPGTDVRADERAALMAMATRMPVTSSVAFIFPRLFSLASLDESVGALDTDGTPHLPPACPLSNEKLEAEGIYLLDNAVSMLLYVGRNAPAHLLESVLRVRSLDGVDCSRLRVPLLDDIETSVRVNRLINAVRSQRPQLLQVARVVTPGRDGMDARFISMLTEDRAQTSMSYVEFLCHVHRQIQHRFN